MNTTHPLGAAEVERIRKDFPILHQDVHGKPLAYLDNAATSQKPLPVIEAVRSFYEQDNAPVHRAVHLLAQRSTLAYEGARERVARFVGASDAREIVFTRGTTEAINLVAGSWGRRNVGPGDEILVTWMEHHSNIVPWQLLCEEVGARLVVLPIDDRGVLCMDELDSLLGDRTRLVALTHVSNALGTINPVAEITERARAAGARVLVDGAQSVPHMPVDVAALGCDFFAFSGHKMCAPPGIGALWARGELLDAMPPWQGGGEMIEVVTFEGSTWNVVPHKFEAGTPNTGGAVGLAAAIDYLEGVGLDRIAAHESALLDYGTGLLEKIPGLRLVGTAPDKAGVLSFVFDRIHAHDVGTILDAEGVAVRTGHHCAQPVMERYGIPATTRASLAFYNTRDDLDALARGLERVVEMFG